MCCALCQCMPTTRTNLRLCAPLLPAVLLASHAAFAGALPNYSSAAHDAAIRNASGAGTQPVQEAITQLQAWNGARLSDPQRLRVRADLVVLLERAGRPRETLAVAGEADLKQLPDYALQSAFAAARSLPDLEAEAALVAEMLRRAPRSREARLREVYWLMDAGRLVQADERLQALETAQIRDRVLRLGVLRARLALAHARGDWQAELAAAESILELEPKDVEAQRERALILARNGGAPSAIDDLPQGVLSDGERAGLRQQAAGQRIGWAVAARDQDKSARRFEAIDAVLADNQAQLTALDTGGLAMPQQDRDDLRLRLWSDRIVALNARARYRDVTELYEKTQRHNIQLPYYALSEVAGAYQAQRKSELAVPLYEQALREGGSNTPVPSQTHVGLVYGYVDVGRFEDADRLLDQLEAASPPMIRQSPERGRPNPQFGEIRQLRALIDLYTDRPKQAERRFLQLSELAPFNASVRAGQARTAQLREHPEQSLERYEQILADHPEDIDVQAGYSVAQMGAGRLREGGATAQRLGPEHPEKAPARYASRVQRELFASNLRIDASFGEGNGTIADRDWRILTRLESALIEGRWRAFFEHFYGHGETDIGDHSRNRSGVGMSWRHDRWEVEAQATQASGGPHRTGAAASLAYRASDHWRLSGSVDTNSNEVPWKAYIAGINGTEYGLGVDYIVDESRRYQAGWRLMDYTDGNQRDGLSLSWTERWHSAPRTQFETTLGGDWAGNSDDGLAYYAPESETSLWLRARGQLLSWKRDDRVFVQRLEGTGGQYFQQGYGSGSLWDMRYEHLWSIGETFLLRYGVGQSWHPYDGDRERRRYGYIGLAVPFQ
ncbi:poly-beta-1,6 N-acetyl-D-glucosamine export porin PgaA [Solimonas sp. SE-A11]|uniref:poly-beta-1,6 N-acetyl-D-glucosamine export porin PgaA n=1 Tax=Solimonas sp. SE-A11 TaxID=3054954 RepID=UPI00345F94C1